MLLLVVACATVETGGDDDSGTRVEPVEVEAVVKSLSATADLCAWDELEEAEAEALATPEGYVGGWLDAPYQPCLDGFMHVSSRVLEHPEGHLEVGDALATFFTLTKPERYWSKGEWLDPLEEEEDCGLVKIGNEGLMTESDIAWLDPGAVTLLGPSERLPLARTEGGFVLNWTTELADPAHGAMYGLDVAGSSGGLGWDGFAGIELPALVTLPDSLELTSPAGLAPGVVFPAVDTELLWTGSGDTPVGISLVAVVGAGLYELRCNAADDGAFTLPGALLAEFPAGATATLRVSRTEESRVGTSLGRSFRAGAYVAYEAWDLVLP